MEKLELIKKVDDAVVNHLGKDVIDMIIENIPIHKTDPRLLTAMILTILAVLVLKGKIILRKQD